MISPRVNKHFLASNENEESLKTRIFLQNKSKEKNEKGNGSGKIQ